MDTLDLWDTLMFGMELDTSLYPLWHLPWHLWC